MRLKQEIKTRQAIPFTAITGKQLLYDPLLEGNETCSLYYPGLLSRFHTLTSTCPPKLFMPTCSRHLPLLPDLPGPRACSQPSLPPPASPLSPHTPQGQPFLLTSQPPSLVSACTSSGCPTCRFPVVTSTPPPESPRRKSNHFQSFCSQPSPGFHHIPREPRVPRKAHRTSLPLLYPFSLLPESTSWEEFPKDLRHSSTPLCPLSVFSDVLKGVSSLSSGYFSKFTFFERLFSGHAHIHTPWPLTTLSPSSLL